METDNSSESPDIVWRLHPFHGIKDVLSPDDPRLTGTFSSNSSVLQSLGEPVRFPTLKPDETDLAILNKHYPEADPRQPPWHDIRADLLAAGISVATVHDATSRDLVRLLERIHKPESSNEDDTEEVEEPSDLYQLRVAAHECTDAIDVYLHFAHRYLVAGEPPEFAAFKGTKMDGPEKTGDYYLEVDLDNPELSLECTLRSLTQFVNDLMEKHQALRDALEPVFEELANVYSGMTNVSGFEGRSLCIALESFAFHAVRGTFEGTEKYAQEGEYDPDIDPEDPVPFTASNWFPALAELLAGFDHIDIADNIHEGIEQELMDAWNKRIAASNPAPKDSVDIDVDSASESALRKGDEYVEQASKALLDLIAQNNSRFEPIEVSIQDSNVPASKSTNPEDESKKSSKSMPDNADVRDLCHLLEKQSGSGKSLIQIAREFTNEPKGNSPKADSLLRQARRYSHLWRKDS